MQMAFLSPPFGYSLFYLKSVAPPQISMATIFKSAVPFIGLQAHMQRAVHRLPADHPLAAEQVLRGALRPPAPSPPARTWTGRRGRALRGLARVSYGVARRASIQASILASSTDIGSAPVSSTWRWNSRTSNLAPSAASARPRRRRMLSSPTL